MIYKRFIDFKKLVMKNDIKLSSKPDGKLHYVYRITDILYNKYYYGSRSSNEIDIGIKYFTSSRDEDFKNRFINSPSNFKIKIIKIFDKILDKNILESFLHKKFDVKNNERFINKSNQTINGFDTTGTIPWNKGIKHYGPILPPKSKVKKCEYCCKKVLKVNYIKWHGENCKLNKKNNLNVIGDSCVISCPYCCERYLNKTEQQQKSFKNKHFNNCKIFKNEKTPLICPYCCNSIYNFKSSKHWKQHLQKCVLKPGNSGVGKFCMWPKNTYPKRLCPYCKKTGRGPNMTRYHFENCKEKL